MRRAKRIICLALCLVMVFSLLPMTAGAAMELIGVELKVPAPKAGEKPGDITISLSWSEIVNVRWEGLDENGCFIPGADYTLYVDVALKEQYHSKYQYRSLEDGFDVTVDVNYVDHKAEILSLTRTTVSAKYTFKGNGGVDFKADEYGTAVANQVITPRSVAKFTATMDMKIPEGTTLKVLRAHIPVTSTYTCHMVEYQGQVVYVFVSTRDATPVLRDIKVQGKLDLNNLPDNCIPNFGEAPELNDIAVSLITLYSFKAEKGSAPVMSHSKNDNISIDIKYSENPVKTAYTWVTATVTYKITNSRYYFADDARLNIVADTVGGEIVSKTKDTLVAKYTVLSTVADPYAVAIPEDMKDYLEYLGNNASYLIPTVAKGKLYDPTGSAKLYSEPRITALSAGNAVPKEFYIHDVNFQDLYPNMVGEWYYVSDLRGTRGFVPAAYVTDITPYDAFEGAPGNNKRSPFEFAGGSGTLADPYLIATADQLNAMRYGPSRHYKLIADIDLSNWGNWIPIGGSPAYGGNPQDSANLAQRGTFMFSGSLDGNGHVISGMTIVIDEETFFMTESGNLRCYGLFATLGYGDNAIIKDLGIINFNIDVKYTNVARSFELFAGAFAGRNMGTDLLNCYSAGGKINVSVHVGQEVSSIQNVTVGGLIGETSTTHIDKSFNTSDLRIYATGSDSVWLRAAGIVCAMDLSHLDECWNSGSITIEPFWPDQWWFDSYAAGLVAAVNFPEIPAIYHLTPEQSSSIFNSYNSGTVKAGNVSGIFNYSAYDVHLRNCYNSGQLIGNKETETDGLPCTAAYVNPAAAIVPFGTEFINNCYGDGNSISGPLWQYSSKLGRMVLKSVPEDSFTIPTVKPAKPSNPFTDVAENAWYAEPVLWAVEKKVTTGTTATTFSPNNTCTRAQILTFLWRAVGSPKATIANPFTDVKTTDYFYDAALWAYGKGMVSGTVFAGTTPCTREATVVYLWKNAGSPATAVSSAFKDVPVSAPYAQAVAWAVAKGVTTGTSATTFSPDTTCTRGQIVTFLYRAVK